MVLHLGKQPARPDAVTFRFADFANINQMPSPPTTFGHEKLVSRWGMLGNDTAGDCVFASTAHATKLWNAEAGRAVRISDRTTLLNYSAFTDYDPEQTDPVTGENPTDQGTDMAAWLTRWRRSGFVDDDGRAHKIGAYIALEPGNVEQLRYASYYFDGVLIGVNFPQQWMDIFNQSGHVWPALKSPNYVGGHCITGVAWHNGMPVIVSWNRKVELTGSAYRQNADEAYAILTREKLLKGIDLQGFNYKKLTSSINQLRAVK